MKKLTLLIAGIFCIGLLSCQEKKVKESKEKEKTESGVPIAVKESFQKKYPDEHDPDWRQDDHGNWESHFKKDGEKYRADFNADGSWIETENSIKEENLPDAVKKKIEEEYPDRKITEVEHVTSAKEGEFYDVEFKQKGKNMDVEIREDGSIIKIEKK